MNKELIKTYFKEFEHWLNGGKVLSKYTLLPEWSDNQTEDIWRIPSKDISKVLIVINDEYVEFRKALAEGKAVEYLDFRDEWRNLKENCRKLEGIDLSRLRIKTDVHKFKVGDWVVHNGVVKQVTKAVDGYIDSLDNEVAVIMKDELLEPWEPKDGDFCWFWNNSNIYPKIATFTNKSLGMHYSDTSNDGFDFCEPYLGRLPSNLK